MTERLMKKADLLVDKFIKKLELKYKTNEKRVYVLKIIIKKLDNYAIKKPRAKNLVEYINKKLTEKMYEYDDSIDDIEKILEQ
jgi:hypothetical protein